MNSSYNTCVRERHPDTAYKPGIPREESSKTIPITTLLLPLAVAVMAGTMQMVSAHKPESLPWTAALIAAGYFFIAAYTLNNRHRFFYRLCITTSLGIALAGALLLWQLATASPNNSTALFSSVSLILIWIYMLSHLGFRLTLLLGWAVSLIAVVVVLATCEVTADNHIHGITLLLAANLIGMGSLKNSEEHAFHLGGIISSLHTKATTDAVTGLYNRHHFDELAEREYSRAKRLQTPISIMLIDIDHFKMINDRYGHLAGDQVLRRLADCLIVNTREIDICGRYGGDEFAVLLTDSDRPAALEVAHRILNCFRGANRITPEGGYQFSISIGIGCSHRFAADCSLASFTHHADQALYTAKKEGRNRVHIFMA